MTMRTCRQVPAKRSMGAGVSEAPGWCRCFAGETFPRFEAVGFGRLCAGLSRLCFFFFWGGVVRVMVMVSRLEY